MTDPTRTRAGDASLAEFWPYVVGRLAADASLRTILGGTLERPRVYYVTDDYGAPEDVPSVVWGRVIVKPTTTIWQFVEAPYETTRISFLVVAEFWDYRQPGYRVDVSLDAAHRRIYDVLQWHVAPPATFDRMVQALHLYRYSAPQQVAQWDGTRSVWFKSAEYRSEAAPKGA